MMPKLFAGLTIASVNATDGTGAVISLTKADAGRWTLVAGMVKNIAVPAPGVAGQWNPELFVDNHAIEPQLPPDYHLSEDLVARSIDLLRNHQASASHTGEVT